MIGSVTACASCATHSPRPAPSPAVPAGAPVRLGDSASFSPEALALLASEQA